MRAAELTLRSLFSFDDQGGVMTFAGERVLLMDAVALGLLRTQLIEGLGLAAARSVLSRFGYSHGWRLAEAMEKAIDWDEPREWRVAGGRLHRLHGLVTFEPVDPSQATPRAFAEAVWKDSYEAEQHILHQGQAPQCVCWTLTGFVSGYLSRANERRIYAMETQCRGRGDALCRMVAKFESDWPADERQAFAAEQGESLTDTLRALTRTLSRAERRLRALRRPGEELAQVAHSQAMQVLLEQLRRVAQVEAPVLISGEPGSGKARLARLLHQLSGRGGGPLLSLSCAAAPRPVLEAELFGQARGADGATVERAGIFEAARGGTALLKDVTELPLPVQGRLVRVLKDGEVRRAGEPRARPVQARVVALASRELTGEVRAGRFREDLAYLLKVVELAVPPLRARPEDIPALARGALEEASAVHHLPPKELSPAAVRALTAYRWPGNVRELKNLMERLTILAPGKRLDVDDLPAEVQRPSTAGLLTPPQRLEDVEREAILSALRAESGSRTRAAERLGIGLATLFRKVKAYQAQGHAVPAPDLPPGRQRAAPFKNG